MKYKVKLDFVFVDLRYSFGLSNVVNPKTSDIDPLLGDAAFLYGHRDDYFRMDNLAITIGYVHPLYKPRKLKNARTKSVLNDIKKQKG